MFGFFKQRRRNKVRSAPFPSAWRAVLTETFPIYNRLSPADRSELEGHIQVFLDEKRFEGCGGFQITDEVRVLIAAQACLLLLHRETDYYPLLHSVLVYPETFVKKTRWREEDEDYDRQLRVRGGESWSTGAVVLAWSYVRRVAMDIDLEDGNNLVFHEFAHQLDQENGVLDGAPLLGSKFSEHRGRCLAWARVLGAEYEQLREAAQTGKETVLDTYGAQNPAEFFAVATECFFGKPHELKRKHPELYDELKRYYQQDPVTLTDPPTSTLEDSRIEA